MWSSSFERRAPRSETLEPFEEDVELAVVEGKSVLDEWVGAVPVEELEDKEEVGESDEVDNGGGTGRCAAVLYASDPGGAGTSLEELEVGWWLALVFDEVLSNTAAIARPRAFSSLASICSCS